MNENHKILLIITAIPIAAILTIFLISKVTFNLSLSPIERKLFNFNYENIPKIIEKDFVHITTCRSPIAFSKSSFKSDFPETPLTEISPPSKHIDKRVSMILVNKSRKVAIIDGKMVNIGDILDHHRIIKIEKDRVLLKNKEGEKWLILE